MKKILLLLTLMFSSFFAQAQDDIKIGILAKRGVEGFYERWLPMAAYLRETTGSSYTMVPLKFEEIDPALRANEIDFLFTNPAMFATLQQKYGLKPIATMVNQSAFGQKTSYFGGVIFTSKNSTGITSLADVAGKRFYAVQESSLGGFQMALGEFISQGIDLRKSASDIVFTGNHDETIRSVLANPGTLGTVRTDIIERMSRAGSLSANDIVILNEKKYKNFPFATSTQLYPEWPIAAAKNTSGDDARRVAEALQSLSDSSFAATSAGVAGWAKPADYSGVRKLLRDIGVLE